MSNLDKERLTWQISLFTSSTTWDSIITFLANISFNCVNVVVTFAATTSVAFPTIFFFTDTTFTVQKISNIVIAIFTLSFGHTASDTMLDIIAGLTISFLVHPVTLFAFPASIRAANGAMLRICAAHTFTALKSVS